MIRHIAIAGAALLVALPADAQMRRSSGPAPETPAGWKIRGDASTSATDPDQSGSIRLTTSGPGYKVTAPQAAVFWNPANNATGNYAIKGLFTLLMPSDHNNYYGLMFGGSNLDAAQQSYSYFVIAQDGTWTIKHRTGSTVRTVVAKTPNAAIIKPNADGKSTNELEVRIGASKIDFVVNGTVVHSMAKGALNARTDGVFGFRVNHRLEVAVDDLAATK